MAQTGVAALGPGWRCGCRPRHRLLAAGQEGAGLSALASAKTWRLGAPLGSEVALVDFRKDVVLEFYNEAGQLVLAYKIHRCWPSLYQAVPPLDSNSAEVAIEQLVLEHEGWERDTSMTEPVELS